MSKTTTVHAYLALVAQLLTTCDEIGATPLRADTKSSLPENSGYCFLRFADGAAALIIPKSAAAVKLCDIHIEVSDLAGWVDLRKPNGRVMGHIDAAQVTDWPELIMRLVGASKRPVKRASSAASPAPVAQDVEALLAKLKTLGTGVKPVASPEPVAYEAELDMLEDMAADLDA